MTTNNQYSDNDVAIIGIGIRFPGNSNNPSELWENLVNGFDGIVETSDRWSDTFIDNGEISSKYAGLVELEEWMSFDSLFFGIADAKQIDPQQRLLLKTTWEAFEDAGIDPLTMRGSDTTVYIGASTQDFSATNSDLRDLPPGEVPLNIFNSNPSAEILAISTSLKEKQIFSALLGSPTAFHSSKQKVVQQELLASTINLKSTQLPTTKIFSTVTGQLLDSINNEYIYENMEKSVLFQQAIENIYKHIESNALGNSIQFLELSPHPTLTHYLKEMIPVGSNYFDQISVLSSLNRNSSDVVEIQTTISQLYCNGYNVDFKCQYSSTQVPSLDEKRKSRLSSYYLPRYQWDESIHFRQSPNAILYRKNGSPYTTMGYRNYSSPHLSYTNKWIQSAMGRVSVTKHNITPPKFNIQECRNRCNWTRLSKPDLYEAIKSTAQLNLTGTLQTVEEAFYGNQCCLAKIALKTNSRLDNESFFNAGILDGCLHSMVIYKESPSLSVFDSIKEVQFFAENIPNSAMDREKIQYIYSYLEGLSTNSNSIIGRVVVMLEDGTVLFTTPYCVFKLSVPQQIEKQIEPPTDILLSNVIQSKDSPLKSPLPLQPIFNQLIPTNPANIKKAFVTCLYAMIKLKYQAITPAGVTSDTVEQLISKYFKISESDSDSRKNLARAYFEMLKTNVAFIDYGAYYGILSKVLSSNDNKTVSFVSNLLMNPVPSLSTTPSQINRPDNKQNQVISEIIKTAITPILNESIVFRILEIGSGIGQNSEIIVSRICSLLTIASKVDIEFTFTNHQDTYASVIKQKLNQIILPTNARVKTLFKTINLDKDLLEQNFNPSYYDMVLVSNVSKITKENQMAVFNDNIYKVLYPNGQLIIIDTLFEPTSNNQEFETYQQWISYNCIDSTTLIEDWKKLLSSKYLDFISTAYAPFIVQVQKPKLLQTLPTGFTVPIDIMKQQYDQIIVFGSTLEGVQTEDETINSLKQNQVVIHRIKTYQEFEIHCNQTQPLTKKSVILFISTVNDLNENNYKEHLFDYIRINQYLLAHQSPSKHILVTKNGLKESINIFASGVIGAFRYFCEFIELNIYCIDFDNGIYEASPLMIVLLDELTNPKKHIQREFIIRNGDQVYFERVIQESNLKTKYSSSSYVIEKENLIANLNSNLEFQLAAKRQVLLPHEIEIKTMAVGINFKDNLIYRNLVPLDLSNQKGESNCSEFGYDTSGIVTRVGSGVTKFKVGDQVFGIGYNTTSSLSVVSQVGCELKPENMSFVEAASDNTILKKILDLIKQDKLDLIPIKEYPVEQIRDAIEYISERKHIGKIVVNYGSTPDLVQMVMEKTNQEFNKNFIVQSPSYELTTNRFGKTILFTGQTGVTISIIRWILQFNTKIQDQRITDIIVFSKSPLKHELEYLKSKQNHLGTSGVKIHFKQVDVSNRDQIEQAINQIYTEQPNLSPVGTTFHNAFQGYIQDDVEKINLQHLNQSLDTKVMGAYYLGDVLQSKGWTPNIYLASSIATLIGSYRQCGYVCANMILDSISKLLRMFGRNCTSIGWSLLGESGYASRTDTVLKLAESQGIVPISNNQFFGALDLIQQNYDTMNSKYIAQFDYQSWSKNKTLLSYKLDYFTNDIESNQILMDEESISIRDEIIEKISTVLSIDSAKISMDLKLVDYGADSLLLVELKNWLDKMYQLPASILPFSQVQNITVNQLVQIVSSFVMKSNKQTKVRLPKSIEIDWKKEVLLDSSTKPAANLLGTYKEVNRTTGGAVVLFTGATGFLGVYTLVELLKSPDAKIVYCLSRKLNKDDIIASLFNLLKLHEIYQQITPEQFSKIRPVVGDYTKDLMGMSEQEYNQLASEVDIVLNAAVDCNFAASYQELKQNVIGVDNGLKFSCHLKLKKFIHLSTTGIYLSSDQTKTYPEHVLPEVTKEVFEHDFMVGYSQTKTVAEYHIKEAAARGIPTMIFRLPFIFTNPETGISEKSKDILQSLFQSCYLMDCYPFETYFTPMYSVPVTWGAINVVFLAFNGHRLQHALPNFYPINLIGQAINFGDIISDLGTLLTWRRITFIQFSKKSKIYDHESTRTIGIFTNDRLSLLKNILLPERFLQNEGLKSLLESNNSYEGWRVTKECVVNHLSYVFKKKIL
eukprot:gene9232-11310_t